MRGPPREVEEPTSLVIPEADPIEGPFRLTRRSYSLEGGSVLVFASDGRYRGHFDGPRDDRVDRQLDEEGRARLRRLASALIALDEDVFDDEAVRDGLRVTYVISREGRADRTIRCANRFPPAAAGVEALVREYLSADW